MKLKCCLLFLTLSSCVTHDTPPSKSSPVEKNQLVSKPSVQYDQTSDVACGVPYMGAYNPKPLPNYIKVPANIRIKVQRRLTDLIGDAFFKQLRYSGGGYVDLDSLYIIEKEAKNYEWKPSSYYLCFELNDSAKGIVYSVTVETDKNGNIVNKIELPDIAHRPEKAFIISKQTAIQIAIAHHFFDTTHLEDMGIRTDINLKYDASRKIFIWEFMRTFDTGGHVTFDVYYHQINGHDGEYLGYSVGHGIH